MQTIRHATTTTTIQVNTAKGTEPKRMRAECTDHAAFVLTKASLQGRRWKLADGYAVTHAPTGMSIAKVDNKAIGHRFVSLLTSKVRDWEDVSAGIASQVGKNGRRAVSDAIRLAREIATAEATPEDAYSRIALAPSMARFLQLPVVSLVQLRDRKKHARETRNAKRRDERRWNAKPSTKVVGETCPDWTVREREQG